MRVKVRVRVRVKARVRVRVAVVMDLEPFSELLRIGDRREAFASAEALGPSVQD